MPIVVFRKSLGERGICGAVGVVVHHVHYHAYSLPVRRMDKILELPYPGGAVIGVLCVASLGNVVVEWVVTPVESCLGVVLVNRLEVEHRQQMNMRNPKRCDVVESHSVTETVSHPVFAECTELSPQPEVSALIGGEIPDMQLVYHRVRVAFQLNRTVAVPSVRVGAREIDYHSANSVSTGGTRVNIYSFPGSAADGEFVGVVHSV